MSDINTQALRVALDIANQEGTLKAQRIERLESALMQEQDRSEYLARASVAVRQRLNVFKEIARCAQETESLVEMRPAECWEAKDQAALDHLDRALRAQAGERPLFDLEEGA